MIMTGILADAGHSDRGTPGHRWLAPMRSTLTSRFILLVAIGVALSACSGETTDPTQGEVASSTAPLVSTTNAGESPLAGQWERAESTYTSLDGTLRFRATARPP